MSAYNPPEYYFNGIQFNSSFYNETEDGLTETQADARYLKKTLADTATALETFTGGIVTNSIQSTTATTNMSIGSSQTNGILNLGAGGLRTATGVINIGTGGTSSPCIVNIANGGVTQAGSVNIANTIGATISTTVNIANGNCTGGVTIGNPANNVTLGGASIFIANNSVPGIVHIKNANNSTGEVQIVTSSSGTNTTPVKISTGTTSGAITIGSSSNTTNLLSGTINIATTSANTTNINIGSTTGTGTVTLATVGPMNLGVVSGPLATQKSVNINGTDDNGGRQYITNLSTFRFRNGTGFNEFNLSNEFSTSYFSIADRQHTGELRIGGGAGVPRSGAINIGGNPNNSCDINIANFPGATALLATSGAINIANGTNAVPGSYTVSTNIGSGSTTGAVTIGGANNTVQINGALTMGTGKNITLQPTSGYVAPTAGSMLGGITSGSFLTPASAFSATKDIATISLIKGTFILSFTFNANASSFPTLDAFVSFAPTSTALPIPNNFAGGSRLTAAVLGYALSFPISITTAGTLILRFTINAGTIDTITQDSYKAIRIA